MARSIQGQDVLDVLSRLIGARGAPKYIRSDNGSEFIAEQVRKWLAKLGVETMYIEPGAPWQNGYAEAFNSRLRDEFLEMNDLQDFAFSGDDDREMNSRFLESRLPPDTVENLEYLINKIDFPLAVRSSSLLEDALCHPFAGVYATKMISKLRNLTYEERLHKLNLPTVAYRQQRGDMINIQVRNRKV